MDSVKIPTTNKNKIIQKDDHNNNQDQEEGDDFYDDMYYEEKLSEYTEMTITLIQKSLLDYVDRKSLTICEYLTADDIQAYLGYS